LAEIHKCGHTISRVHEKRNPQLCTLCGKSFQSASNLRKHVEAVHEKKQFECIECQEIFKSEFTYKQHMAYKHEGKEMFKCDICNVELKTKFSLKNHIAFMHEGNR